ncbi:glycosyltransferase family 2 protein [Thermodesulfobacteriota bacterium]
MISIVIPCYNEEKALPVLYKRLSASADTWGETYEVILVDDCSQDSSWAIIDDINRSDIRWKAIRFSRNFGHQIAITAGINHSRGDCVIIMDADLQDPPEILHKFIEKWKAGYEVIYGIRATRKENIFKKTCYSFFYRLLGKVSNTDIPNDSGDFCLMDKKVATILNEMPEQNRFVRGLRAWTGFSQTGIEYDREARAAGEVQYTFIKLLKLATDGIFSFSITPIRIATFFGLGISLVAAIAALYILIWRLVSDFELPGYATTILSILFLGGVQLITIGIIGEYIGRIYDEVKRRPLWIKEKSVGFEENEDHK